VVLGSLQILTIHQHAFINMKVTCFELQSKDGKVTPRTVDGGELDAMSLDISEATPRLIP
jgi:hypothetical protein